MMKMTTLVLMASVIFAASVQAKTKLVSTNYENSNGLGKITLVLDGESRGTPELLIKENIIQVSMDDAVVWPKVEKKINIGSGSQATLMAYQYSKDQVRVRAIMPFAATEIEKSVTLNLKGNNVVVEFPLAHSKGATAVKQDSKKGEDASLVKILDDQRLKDNQEVVEDKVNNTMAAPVDVVEKKRDVPTFEKRDRSNTISLVGYAARFIIFLGIVIGLFFALVAGFKKGILKKGRLGFLKSSELVTVLNTTYLAPKKSVVTIKIHNQVIVLGSDEKGIHFLTEIRDAAALLKSGEKSISGSNFDSALVSEETNPVETKNMRIKENIAESEGHSDLDNFLSAAETVTDEVKLSQQIKNKFKSLKPLQ